ncbi:MAG: Thymidylate kinase [Chlamydiae bacterium]|nr:Thymidylate kinase [Chlamydiota bacterium]
MPGHFITFEGGDGAGKSTLIQSLLEALQSLGHDVMQTRAPGGTPAGQTIRELLLHPTDPLVARAELLLFLADRAQQVEKVILPALDQGKIVLCDRYNDSTLAYQGKARGFPLKEVENLCAFATQSLRPELTLYLDLDPRIGIERVKQSSSKDQIEAEKISFHETIRTAFHELAAADPSRFRIIDASQPKEIVLKESLKQIEDSLVRK